MPIQRHCKLKERHDRDLVPDQSRQVTAPYRAMNSVLGGMTFSVLLLPKGDRRAMILVLGHQVTSLVYWCEGSSLAQYWFHQGTSDLIGH